VKGKVVLCFPPLSQNRLLHDLSQQNTLDCSVSLFYLRIRQKRLVHFWKQCSLEWRSNSETMLCSLHLNRQLSDIGRFPDTANLKTT